MCTGNERGSSLIEFVLVLPLVAGLAMISFRLAQGAWRDVGMSHQAETLQKLGGLKSKFLFALPDVRQPSERNYSSLRLFEIDWNSSALNHWTTVAMIRDEK